MILSMQLTMDGLVRALRMRLHALAEDVERKEKPQQRPSKEAGDERGG